MMVERGPFGGIELDGTPEKVMRALGMHEMRMSELTRDEVVLRWGCDACGVRSFMYIQKDVHVRCLDEDWRLSNLMICKVCSGNRGLDSVAADIVINALKRGLPVKTMIFRAPDELVWNGLDTWFSFVGVMKDETVAQRFAAELSNDDREALRRKLVRGRVALLAVSNEEES